MKIREAIVLAGGTGTRLQPVLPGVPKCLAPVHGHPFIAYVTNHLRKLGIQRFVFALGYKAEMVEQTLRALQQNNEFIYASEHKALGTGGAISQAITKCVDENVLIVNGDTLFNASIESAIALHLKQNATCTLLLKPMQDCSRYGTVSIDHSNRITRFGEKEHKANGLINAGMYILNIAHFKSMQWPEEFSFEKDFLQAKVESEMLYGIACDAYFVDIGIPEDYQKAQLDFDNDD